MDLVLEERRTPGPRIPGSRAGLDVVTKESESGGKCQIHSYRS